MATTTTTTTTKRFRLLSRLRRAIHKVKFLLSFDATRWVVSSITGMSPLPRPRRLSFKSRPGLADAADESYFEASSSFGLSRTSSSASESIARTASDASSTPGADDIDRRADIFIENFYKRIQMEREVSLKLRYCEREKSLERTQSD